MYGNPLDAVAAQSMVDGSTIFPDVVTTLMLLRLR